MIKMVVCDVDGTLIGRDEIISQKAVELSKRLKDAGILFTVATGRVENMVIDYVNDLNIDIPYITSNGATIAFKDNIYVRNTVPLQGLKDIMKEADSLDMTLVYSVEGKEYVVKETPWILKQRAKFDRYHDMANLNEEKLKTLEIDKLMIMDDVRTGDISILERMAEKLSENYGYTRYTNKSIEIINKNSTKGTALSKLADIVGVSLNETLVIGDHMNDIELLENAGIGAAVANAQESLKELADYVSDYPEIDGVIDIVNKYLEV